jgi:hypothetical protein
MIRKYRLILQGCTAFAVTFRSSCNAEDRFGLPVTAARQGWYTTKRTLDKHRTIVRRVVAKTTLFATRRVMHFH